MHYIFIAASIFAAICISIPLTIIIVGFLRGCMLALYNFRDAFIEAHSIEK